MLWVWMVFAGTENHEEMALKLTVPNGLRRFHCIVNSSTLGTKLIDNIESEIVSSVSQSTNIKIHPWVARDRSVVRSNVTLAVNPGSLPSSHLMAHSHLSLQCYGIQLPFLASTRTRHMCGTHIYIQTSVHTHKTKVSLKKRGKNLQRHIAYML